MGDILTQTEPTYTIKHSELMALLRCIQIGLDNTVEAHNYHINSYGSGFTFCKSNLEKIAEVLGNIFENPELMEVKP